MGVNYEAYVFVCVLSELRRSVLISGLTVIPDHDTLTLTRTSSAQMCKNVSTFSSTFLHITSPSHHTHHFLTMASGISSPERPASPDPQLAAEVAADIAARSRVLVQEMEQLRQRLFEIHGDNHHLTGLIAQITMIKSENTAAERFLASLTDDSIKWKGSKERFRNSNVPAFEQLWGIVKRCRHVTALQHQFKISAKKEVGTGKTPQGVEARKERGPEVYHRGKLKQLTEDVANVNAAVDGGAEWIKIISTPERRLLQIMADAGWEWGVEDDDSEDEQDEAALFEDIEPLRTAMQLLRASRQYWHKYKHPRIRFIFTRIQEGHNKEIDRLIRKIRNMDWDGITAIFHFADSEWATNDPPIAFETAISNLLPQHDDITDTVILDPSVLIALASDITHKQVEQQVWQEQDAKSQIQAEADGEHYVQTVYPRIRGRKLVCTPKAVKQFLRIADTIGSTDEMKRAVQLIAGTREGFEKLSTYPVPEDLILPVEVAWEEGIIPAAKSLVADGILPPVAIEVERHCQVTHMYGWRKGLTVITGNRVLTNRIVHIVEESLARENGNRDYDEGPRIYCLALNRALGTRGPSLKKARKLAKQGLWPPKGQRGLVVPVDIPTPSCATLLEQLAKRL